MKTIQEVLASSVKKLRNSKIPSAQLDAEVLLSFTIKKPKEFIYSHPEYKLTKVQQIKFQKIISRRTKYEPIAYITGQKEFFGLDFCVDKNVLIPRPETELLIEGVINYIKRVKLNIIDIGTGSGCIAITLKKYLPKANVTATDISKHALNAAQKNAKKHKVKINFIQSDLLKNLSNKKIDIIIANLPYLDDKQKNQRTETRFLKHEPQLAFGGGKYGLEIYEKLFQQINQLKYQPQVIFCEIGHAYLNQTRKLVKKYFPQQNFKIKKDLSDKNRILIIYL